MKALRHKEDLKSNLTFLQEQILFRKKKERFERDAEVKQAKHMNKLAAEEIERENKRSKEQRLKRIQHNDELRAQGTYSSLYEFRSR